MRFSNLQNPHKAVFAYIAIKRVPPGLICDHPDLANSYEEVRHSYLDARPKFSGTDLKVFRAGQTSWSGDMGTDCFSLDPDGKYRTPSWEMQCMKDRLVQRLDFLRAINADPSRLKASVAQYETIEIWYLKKFAKEYEGKHVSVWGWSQIADCKHETASVPHPTRLVEGMSLPLRKDALSIPIRFKSLEDIDVSFLCGKQPGGWWDGTVILDRGGPSLYATEIMGRKLH